MSQTYLTFHQRVERAGYVFAGTVDSLTSEKTDMTIVTHVVFGKLSWAKGSWGEARIGLTLEGGKVGSINLFAWAPAFTVGRRYVVLARPSRGSPADSYTAVVGQTNGAFPVEVDSARAPRVFTWGMRPIVGIGREDLVLASDSSASNAMTEVEFLDSIRVLVERAVDH